jgi:hypothetical protein
VAFATPEANAERSFAAKQLVLPNMSSGRMSSPHMTSQRMSPNISTPRIVANLSGRERQAFHLYLRRA